MKMTRAMVLAIPDMKEKGMSHQEIADHYGVAFRTIQYWVRRLRAEGFDIKNKKPVGRPAMRLRD